jgi:hypothetical protein
MRLFRRNPTKTPRTPTPAERAAAERAQRDAREAAEWAERVARAHEDALARFRQGDGTDGVGFSDGLSGLSRSERVDRLLSILRGQW